MKNLIALILMMAIMPMVFPQRTINVGDIIHNEFEKSQENDPFINHRKELPFLDKFVVNNGSDTVYGIELLSYSEYETYVSVSYWTSHSIFSALQEHNIDIVFKIKYEKYLLKKKKKKIIYVYILHQVMK